jgi:23S rRNA (cytidine1920-2'-O)/16S rRNA (cytidine1409-2'-O)-methyltransferase
LKRLDQIVQGQYSFLTRNQAALKIKQGLVTVDGIVMCKPGIKVSEHSAITCDLSEHYVSFAGKKLAYALDHFGVDVTGLVCLDAGLSTGGFADCLLQRGAKQVYGVDVGTGQVDSLLATDERLIVMEQTNLSDVQLGERVDFVSLDLSFVSVCKHIDHVMDQLITSPGKLFVLVKPQFEVGAQALSKSGVVTDQKAIKDAIASVVSAFEQKGAVVEGAVEVPRKNEQVNQEYMLYIKS